MAERGDSITALRARAGELSEEELARLARDDRAGVRALAATEARRREAEAAEAARLTQMLAHERRLWKRGLALVAGVDEVGVGPLAGPVVAAAAILPPGTRIRDVDDSKRLTFKQRRRLALIIQEKALCFAYGSASPEEIADLNIYQASLLAMRRAVEGLAPAPEHLLVDARIIPGVLATQTRLVHGDQLSLSIAAASILAKVYRDALMEESALIYPGYGFEKHRGYGTAAHLEALARLGPCPIHRFSFAPVAASVVVPIAGRRRRERARSGSTACRA